MENLKVWEKYSWIMQNVIRRWDQIIQPFCKIVFSQEIRSLLFNLWRFWNSEKSTPESCRIHWNVMNDKEFWSLKVLKLKYRKGDQKIQSFPRFGFRQEIRTPYLISRNFESLRKPPLHPWVMLKGFKHNEW